MDEISSAWIEEKQKRVVESALHKFGLGANCQWLLTHKFHYVKETKVKTWQCPILGNPTKRHGLQGIKHCAKEIQPNSIVLSNSTLFSMCLLFGKFFVFSNFYQLDIHNKICVALANLQRNICKNRIENRMPPNLILIVKSVGLLIS